MQADCRDALIAYAVAAVPHESSVRRYTLEVPR